MLGIDNVIGTVQAGIDPVAREIKDLQIDVYDPNLDGDDTVHDQEWEAQQLLRVPAELGPSLKLSWKQRYNARQRALRAALLGFHHRDKVHYTQGARRWDWWAEKDHALEGQYPRYADCSAFLTWCYWDATRLYKLGDFVNGTNWSGGGYTGTQMRYGAIVENVPKRLLVADALYYGGTYLHPTHVAIYAGNGLVISHGSERGPLLLRWDYRKDFNHARRFIR